MTVSNHLEFPVVLRVGAESVSRIARITVFNEAGKEVPITSEMRKAKDVYQRLIQEIIMTHEVLCDKPIVSITEAGSEISHLEANTFKQWNSLVYFLLHPQFVDKNKVKVDIVEPSLSKAITCDSMSSQDPSKRSPPRVEKTPKEPAEHVLGDRSESDELDKRDLKRFIDICKSFREIENRRANDQP